MGVYYNEIDPKAAAWLSQLMKAGLIPDGDIDERSIADVRGSDLAGYTQCHFFAGIGGWPFALSLAGWGERPVWTGSCPCQPFSTAGKKRGRRDERHLWPEFFRLIKECRPDVVLGEQVASAEVVGYAGEGLRVPDDVQEAEPRSRFSSSRSVQGAQEADSVRSDGSPAGDSGTDRRGVLRGLESTVQPRWREDMGLAFDRSDRLERRLHVQQYPGGLPCGEQRDGGLGRSEVSGDRQFDPEKAASILQRLVRENRAKFDEATGHRWLTGVCLDLAEIGYVVGASVLPAAGIGAPHIRQRLYWVADSAWGGRGVKRNAALTGHSGYPDRSIPAGGMGDTDITRPQGRGLDAGEYASELIAGQAGPVGGLGEPNGAGCLSGESSGATVGYRGSIEPAGTACGLADAEHSERWPEQQPGGPRGRRAGSGGGSPVGAWDRYDILHCSDGKARRVEAGTFPLDTGIPARMGRLRGYGNAIVPQVAAAFIEAFVESGE